MLKKILLLLKNYMKYQSKTKNKYSVINIFKLIFCYIIILFFIYFRESVGLSGRVLKKITFIAHSIYIRQPKCDGVHLFLSALSKAIKYQKTQDASINKIK